MIEEVENGTDAITYSALKRIKLNFEVLEVFTHESGEINFQNAIGYKGKYVDKAGLDHTLLIVHGVNENKGFQIICDATSNIMDQVEKKFLVSLQSIRK